MPLTVLYFWNIRVSQSETKAFCLPPFAPFWMPWLPCQHLQPETKRQTVHCSVRMGRCHRINWTQVQLGSTVQLNWLSSSNPIFPHPHARVQLCGYVMVQQFHLYLERNEVREAQSELLNVTEHFPQAHMHETKALTSNVQPFEPFEPSLVPLVAELTPSEESH